MSTTRDRTIAKQAQAAIDKGVKAMDRGDLLAAEQSFIAATHIAKFDLTPWLYIGEVYRRDNRAPDALHLAEKVVAMQPENAQAVKLKALSLFVLRRHSEAAEAFGKLETLQALSADLYNDWGVALIHIGRSREAVDKILAGIGQQFDLLQGHATLGVAFEMLGLRAEAATSYETALILKPEWLAVRAAILHQHQHLCDWTDFNSEVEKLKQHILDAPEGQSVQPFTQLALPVDGAFQYEATRRHALTHFPKGVEMPPVELGSRRQRGQSERLRVGYLSNDFIEHATSQLMAELFELHDKSRFEIYAYSYANPDESERAQRIKKACDHFIDIRTLSDADSAQRIRDDEIDILIDLKGYTLGTRNQILAYRPAPVSVNYLGYPGTLAAPYADYLVTDETICPLSLEANFSEKFAWMPHSYQPNDRQRAIAKTPSRAEVGLPETGFVFAAFNTLYKITPDVFDLWMRILDGVPNSVLWLWGSHEIAVKNLKKEAEQRGVDPERLIFAPRLENAAHLARLSLADLFLDTYPCAAHTTASDALWAGLPLITRIGDTFASRVAASLLKAANLPELITHTASDYEALALELAHNTEKRLGLRSRLAEQRLSCPLFDTPSYTRALEQLFNRMFENWLAKRPPCHLDLQGPR